MRLPLPSLVRQRNTKRGLEMQTPAAQNTCKRLLLLSPQVATYSQHRCFGLSLAQDAFVKPGRHLGGTAQVQAHIIQAVLLKQLITRFYVNFTVGQAAKCQHQ
jgi:hypothetical protein